MAAFAFLFLYGLACAFLGVLVLAAAQSTLRRRRWRLVRRTGRDTFIFYAERGPRLQFPLSADAVVRSPFSRERVEVGRCWLGSAGETADVLAATRADARMKVAALNANDRLMKETA